MYAEILNLGWDIKIPKLFLVIRSLHCNFLLEGAILTFYPIRALIIKHPIPPRGVQWAVPPILARGPAHYNIMSCRTDLIIVVG